MPPWAAESKQAAWAELNKYSVELLVNMLDRPRVAELAEEMGFEESARWVRESRSLYSRAIFAGFEVER